MKRRLLSLMVLFSVVVSVPVLAQTPPGGGNGQPIPIAPGLVPIKVLLPNEPLRLQLSGPFDAAYTISAPQTVSIYVRSLPDNPTPLDTTLEIDDPRGNQVAYNDDLTADSRDAGVENIQLTALGTYVIKLNSFDLLQGGAVEVQLVTDGSPQPVPTSSASGNAILDTTGTLDGDNPASFNFQGTSGQVVTIKVAAISPPSDDMDLTMTLYGPDGSDVADDDDSGSSVGLGDNDPALIHFTLSQTGQYRLEVTSWFDTPGTFSVTIEPG